eukprot:GHVU01069426.1.p1 GENE.GHVU01069426.1~~GHVU01069426.1.p1  ORF type:complete len:253 (-),score=25.19 GHVU01069426.1:140-898(-)
MVEEGSEAFRQLAIDTVTSLVQRGAPTINADGSVELPHERPMAHFNVETGEITAETRRRLERRLQRQMDDAQAEIRAQWIAAGEEQVAPAGDEDTTTPARGGGVPQDGDGEENPAETTADHRDESRWRAPDHVVERRARQHRGEEEEAPTATVWTAPEHATERLAVTLGSNGISVWRSPTHIGERIGATAVHADASPTQVDRRGVTAEHAEPIWRSPEHLVEGRARRARMIPCGRHDFESADFLDVSTCIDV